MKQTVISLMGLAVTIKYIVHPLEQYIEWYLVTEDEDISDLNRSNDTLLETLLRHNFTHYIESRIREVVFYENYAAQEAAAAQDPHTGF